MKTGEKVAMGITTALVIGMVVLAIMHEPSMKKMDPTDASVTPQRGQAGPTEVLLIPQGLLPQDLPDAESPGAKALGLYCSQCHDLPPPAMHSEKEWPTVLKRMRDHMSKQGGGMLVRIIVPPEREWEKLASYLALHGQKALSETNHMYQNSAGFQAFSTYCSVCHALPDPKQHTGNEWARTILRMKQHMLRAKKKVPDDSNSEAIEAFLRQHGAAKSL